MSPETMVKIKRFVAEIASREGCELYDLEFAGSSRGRVLRVYIDREGGASLDDCANVSRELNLVLDVEDLVPGGAYDLEVSTPGLDRKLTEPWHFERAVGQMVHIKALKPISTANGRPEVRVFDAKLMGVENGSLKLKNNDQEFGLEMGEVENARIIFEPSKLQKKPGKKG